ncbi:hypothetical protein [Lentimonas sp. CC4]|uniref:hypothetical protein n=1 Tax=Lentimonas sp. CC4 TaxID=2676099 RepID=UPI00138A5CE1|nr:hypothetical protein [Lentimonas sp. CC4]
MAPGDVAGLAAALDQISADPEGLLEKRERRMRMRIWGRMPWRRNGRARCAESDRVKDYVPRD